MASASFMVFLSTHSRCFSGALVCSRSAPHSAGAYVALLPNTAVHRLRKCERVAKTHATKMGGPNAGIVEGSISKLGRFALNGFQIDARALQVFGHGSGR